ncbi:class I SAM-dependent methyltransferase [Halopiger djelfimassiliensis]|uniref:class I SAM-dependent methyltransferase n=1 Tax=Halopiger djelfimassiliensis TaxID=1293047 RepID=UPI0006776BE0|nr:class I SAM-dependent methyltransferase [Halopiger djelfimassiliensis]
MDVPRTVRRALADRTIDGRVCLEAGAGVGNATVGLLEAGAAEVYALTDDAEHARDVRDRVAGDDRGSILRADLRSIPLPDDAVDVVTAHALFNVLPPADAATVAAELTRVVAPGGCLVVDDYAPLPGSSPVRRLFAVENAAAELAAGRPALTFYPVAGLERLFAGYGWRLDRTRTILEPVPWTSDLLEAHADVVRRHTATLPAALAEPLVDRADRLVDEIGSAAVGEMYSLAMTAPEREST